MPDQPGPFHDQILTQVTAMGVKVSDARKDALKDFLGWVNPFFLAFIMTALVLFAIHFQEIWGKKP